jgi:protease IV
MVDTAEESRGWERQTLEKVALAAVVEQRRARRWGIFFKLIGFVYLFLLLFVLLGWISRTNEMTLPGRHTALVDLRGVIAPDSRASAELIVKGLRNAFDDSNTAGVILRINSPGGSAVQAGIISDEIKRLKKAHPDVPIYTVVEDVCASGGYYVASATDKIYVNPASLVGSIGVLIDGFGFSDALHKLGVERRLITAGKHKGFLDPFSPLEPEDRAYAEQMVEQIHQQFIAAVKAGRGARLKDSPELFSGLVWTGATSVKLGLADGFGTTDEIARDVIKAKDIVDYTPQQSLAERLARRIGTRLASTLLGAGTGVEMR